MAFIVDHLATAQFENENGLRMFPFTGDSSLVDRSGRTLGKNVIVDLHMLIPCDIRETEAPVTRLTSVHLSRYMVSACFCAGSGASATALSVMVSADSFAPYCPYRLDRLAGSSDAGGVVTFGDIQFPELPETYFLDSAQVHPCCIVAARPSGLRRFTDVRSGDYVSGDVKIGFSGYVNASRDGKSYRLALDKGADRELMSECIKSSESDACGSTPISSINGVHPDDDGNIVLWFH